MTGYLHPLYASSLKEFGKPTELRHSRGWLLKRAISFSPFHDAMGCYPLFCCQRWDGLFDDLCELNSDIVSVAMVTDPFGDYTDDLLARCFPDKCVGFKKHYITSLEKSREAVVVPQHKRKARKALASLQISVCQMPHMFLDEWCALYSVL